MKIRTNGNKLVRNLSAHFLLYASMARKNTNLAKKTSNQMLIITFMGRKT